MLTTTLSLSLTAFQCSELSLSLSQNFLETKLGKKDEVKRQKLFTKQKKSLCRSSSASASALPFARRGLGLLHQRPKLRRHLVGALEHRGRVAQHVPRRRLQLLGRQRDAAALAVVREDEHLDLVSGGQDLVDGRDVVVGDLRDVEQACFYDVFLLLVLRRRKKETGEKGGKRCELLFTVSFLASREKKRKKEKRRARKVFFFQLYTHR